MGVGDWFSTFCGELPVKNTESISRRYKTITKRLNRDFWGTNSESLHSLYVGSYGRNTATNLISDLDIIFRLPYAEYEKYNGYISNGQSALIQAVKQSIERTYSTTKIRGDGQVIQIPFDDDITFEVVPAFSNKDDSFTFPDANNGGRWRITNPKPEIAAIRQRNSDFNSNLIPLCRMMRAWKSKWNVPIGGLLIDTLAYQFIGNWEYRDKSYLYYDYMCRDFFKYLSEQSTTQEYWIAPKSAQHVYRKGLFEAKAKRCYNIALKAIEHETATPKQEWSAKQKWREIFGSKYPS